MPHRLCSQCQRPGRLLEASSQDAWVMYYRCDACGHVWSQDKMDLNAPPRDVTLRGREDKPSNLLGTRPR